MADFLQVADKSQSQTTNLPWKTLWAITMRLFKLSYGVSFTGILNPHLADAKSEIQTVYSK